MSDFTPQADMVPSNPSSRPASPPQPHNQELVDIGAFRPAATQSARCSKMKMRLFLDSNVFIAGGNVYGRMELTSATSRSLLLGEISVELTGYEEVCTRDMTASRSFLSSRLVFQGANVPPSNAVHGPAERGNFWLARKGRTTFPFAFHIPEDAPSTVNFQNIAALRYVVTGLIQIFHGGHEDTVFKSKEAFVVESWHRGAGTSTDSEEPYGSATEAAAIRRLFLGGPGSLQLAVSLKQSVFRSGQNIPLMVRVRNDTRRRVQGIKVNIGHRLRVHVASHEAPRVVSQTISESFFDNGDFSFQPGAERAAIIHVAASSKIRTAQQNSLFRIECFLTIGCYIGPLSRDLTVELPITLLHAASVSTPVALDLARNRYSNQYNLLDEDAILALAGERNGETKHGRRRAKTDALPPAIEVSPSPPGHRALPWHSNDEFRHDARLSPAASSSAPDLPLSDARPSSPIPVSLTQLASASDAAEGRLVAGSPTPGPTAPIAYMPARERVRYAPFRAPPTAKALSSPLRPILYGDNGTPRPGVDARNRDIQSSPETTPSGVSSAVSSANSSAAVTPLSGSPQVHAGQPSGLSALLRWQATNHTATNSADGEAASRLPRNQRMVQTPPAGGYLDDAIAMPSPLREEVVMAGSLPTSMECVLNGTRRGPVGTGMPVSPSKSPRPLPVPPVRPAQASAAAMPTGVMSGADHALAAPTPVATSPPSGISRLFQWGAASLGQLVGSTADPTVPSSSGVVVPESQLKPSPAPSDGAAVLPGSWQGKRQLGARHNVPAVSGDAESEESSDEHHEHDERAGRRALAPRVLVARRAKEPVLADGLAYVSRKHGADADAERSSEAVAAAIGNQRRWQRPGLSNPMSFGSRAPVASAAPSRALSPRLASAAVSNGNAQNPQQRSVPDPYTAGPAGNQPPLASTNMSAHSRLPQEPIIRMPSPNMARRLPTPPRGPVFAAPVGGFVVRPMTPKLREYMQRYADAATSARAYP
ncbi:hypothetical protein THASP1DRAFT_30934 [Thamnocephalis sphaerospora]|uniref:Arrestin C-terminal-like domain-containing protein n=1 Tax=Thamnocephalis sphaerospora TaxID=78915 RepID=A0A4P9XMW9_9FUNG|nr:hypothetical protein THASP1DRAFT_30934 [Thamnocephalis sphaerospora]|eukprot:RKP07246.1 hypothetical protein THASP1DRAFT_30934 [Thamnocephalis sphaerospora]